MKKLLFAAALCFSAFITHAQTAAVRFSSTASMPLSIALVGINEDATPCDDGLSTMLYGMSPAATIVTGSSAVPYPMTYINRANIDVDMGGVHYGASLPLCGISTGTQTLSFGGGVYTCKVDIPGVSPSMITLRFY